MKVKFDKATVDFIIKTFCCNDSSVGAEIEEGKYKSTYFATLVYIQNSDERESGIFDVKHISELDKEDLLVVLKHMITNYMPPEVLTAIENNFK